MWPMIRFWCAPKFFHANSNCPQFGARKINRIYLHVRCVAFVEIQRDDSQGWGWAKLFKSTWSGHPGKLMSLKLLPTRRVEQVARLCVADRLESFWIEWNQKQVDNECKQTNKQTFAIKQKSNWEESTSPVCGGIRWGIVPLFTPNVM